MTDREARPDIRAEPTSLPPLRWIPGLFEIAASGLALYAMGALLLNKLDTIVAFLGETPTTEPYHVAEYHLWVSVLAGAVVASFGACLWRRRPPGRAIWWHVVVLVLAALSAALFHVTTDSPEPEPVPERRGNHVCHSGGDSDECVGG